MPRVVYCEPDGTEHMVEASAGTSLMQAAVNELIPGIEGDCGGLCACGTCHVYVPEQWAQLCGEADELERDILAFAYDVAANSRLACQIVLTDALDGIRVELPKRQY